MAKRSPRKEVPGQDARKSEHEPTLPELVVDVVWGDITKADAQVYAVGHYVGVPPQWAERALDQKVSRWEKEGDRLIITDFARRGVFRGAIGEIAFFPWDPDGKLVAVVGMGRHGTFNRPQLQILARGLARSVGLLPDRTRLATVLIGSGDGNLGVADAVTGLLDGFVNALTEDRTLKVEQLRIVERDLARALEILQKLTELVSSRTVKSRIEGRLNLDCKEKLSEDPNGGGVVCPEFGCSLLLGALAEIDGDDAHADIEKAIGRLLSKYPYKLPALLKQKFQQLKRDLKVQGLDEIERVKRLAMGLRVQEPRDGEALEGIPTRVSFWTGGQDIYASAITNRVTVTERRIFNRLPLIEGEIERLTDPPPDQFEKDRASDLQRMLIHSDFREVLGKSESLVIEVDGKMARVQWEMLPSLSGEEPLGVTARVARQLRTTYAPRPDDTRAGRRLKVLIIGDPDDSLKDARTEAQKVNELLKATLGEDAMEALIGAPEDGTLGGTVAGFRPASYSHVVKGLLRGDYDIVHYCGHAAFDPEDPTRAGWIFKHGRLTAADLEGMERPPILVVANACLTSQLGQSTQAQGTRGLSQDSRTRPRGDPRLVASLADEFFHRGVSHYIGTAWEVPSGPAKDFATEFYTQLLQKQPVGEAVRLARKRLLDSAGSYGEENAMAWAAYQHYGDPNTALEFDVISPNSDARTTTRSLS